MFAGYQDFIPERLANRHGRAHYESFCHVFQRAARWIRLKPQITVTNLQTINVKLKKSESAINVVVDN